MDGGERLVLHPGREALVQPDVVPPGHRHEIAEPLVRHLVRQNRPDLLARVDRGCLGVGQQIVLAVEDRRRVLHRAGREVGHRDDVELPERIFDAVVAVVEGEDLLRRLERDPSEVALVRGRADADRDAFRRAVEALEVADGHRDQVRRHLRGGRKLDRVLRRRRPGHVGKHLAVGDGGIAAIDGQRHGKGRLEGRLVEARKRPARVGRLELRDGVLPQRRLADVEPAQLAVQGAAVADADLGLPLLDRPCDGQRRGLAWLVQRDLGGLRRGAGADRDVLELEFGGVEHDFRRRFGHLDADGLGALEPFAPEVDDEREVVMIGGDRRRKPLCGRR